METRRALIKISLIVCVFVGCADAQKKKLLLLGQKPDGHPRLTHEYMPAQRLLAKLLAPIKQIDAKVIQADNPWTEGPDLLKEADGVVLFVSEGAKWVNEDPRRYQAFADLATRKGGFVALHWGTGTRDAKNIKPYLRLIGGCHGGPDRRYKVVTSELKPVAADHPISTKLLPLTLRDEFYFKLKLANPKAITPILKVQIEGSDETVAWAYDRPNGGRSFGFTGLHFHENWKHTLYRRLVVQATLWSLGLEVPKDGASVDLKK